MPAIMARATSPPAVPPTTPAITSVGDPPELPPAVVFVLLDDMDGEAECEEGGREGLVDPEVEGARGGLLEPDCEGDTEAVVDTEGAVEADTLADVDADGLEESDADMEADVDADWEVEVDGESEAD